MGSSAQIYLHVIVNGDSEYTSDPVELSGWKQWKTPKITDIPVEDGDTVQVGMYVSGGAKGWGTIDDFEFFSQQ